jgi:hypothetical protein
MARGIAARRHCYPGNGGGHTACAKHRQDARQPGDQDRETADAMELAHDNLL